MVEIALEHPEKSPRELAWHITEKQGYNISESSVYWIPKAHDLVTCPVYKAISAQDRFPIRAKIQMNCGGPTFPGSRLCTRAGTICAQF